jgi:hypothetical protein
MARTESYAGKLLPEDAVGGGDLARSIEQTESQSQELSKAQALAHARARAAVFLLATAAVVAAAFALTAALAFRAGQWKGASWFLNGEQEYSTRSFLMSAASGVVFGLIANSLLHFSMDSLGPFLPGGELTRAGWGNTFAGGVGAFLAAFAAKAIQLSTGFQGGPLYGDAAGVIAGCIAGIFIPRAITGKQ